MMSLVNLQPVITLFSEVSLFSPSYSEERPLEMKTKITALISLVILAQHRRVSEDLR